MRVLITWATGTIGLAVADALRGRGDQVVALSRDPERGQRVLGDGAEVHAWTRPTDELPPAEALAGLDGVINVIGEPIDQRWSDEIKQRLHDSRVLTTRSLVAGLKTLPESGRPSVLVSQSASGYYGARDSTPLDEQASPGSDFLAKLVVEWEREAQSAAPIMRVVCTRSGIVLAQSGGALSRMLPFFKLGVGGPVAGGQQYVPWIHLDDMVGSLLFCLDNEAAQGPVNTTANPVTNAELSQALGRVLSRPAVLPVPAFALKLLYGEMAEIVTTGARVVPSKLEELGYSFRYPEIERALRDVLSDS